MPRKQDSGWIGDFLDSPLGLVMQGVGEKQIHSTPGGKRIGLKSSLGHGEDFLDAAVLNEIRRINRAKTDRPRVPVRAAGETLPHLQRGPGRVAVDGLGVPEVSPELIRRSMEALSGQRLDQVLAGAPSMGLRR